MKRFIVTTSINTPTEATRLFARKSGWTLIVVGDQKTPHAEYEALECIYLHPGVQASRYPDLSRAIPWNSIQRRNIGFVEAFHRGADVIATVDDDNIAYDCWGEDLLIGRDVEIDLYEPDVDVFDPLAPTTEHRVWHRGFPIQYVPVRHRMRYAGKAQRRILVQADLWDGDPDIDAIARLTIAPVAKFGAMLPYGSNRIAPFNSQNTFLAREVVPYYAVLPFVGRMDDIWGSYVLQQRFPQCAVYNRPSVYQARNAQDLITNLEREVLGYRHTLDFIHGAADLALPFVPEAARRFYEIYRSQFS